MMKNAAVKMAANSKEKMPMAGKGRVPVVPQGYMNGGMAKPKAYGNGGMVDPNQQGMKNGGKVKAGAGDEAKSRRNAMNQRMMAAGKSARKK